MKRIKEYLYWLLIAPVGVPSPKETPVDKTTRPVTPRAVTPSYPIPMDLPKAMNDMANRTGRPLTAQDASTLNFAATEVRRLQNIERGLREFMAKNGDTTPV